MAIGESFRINGWTVEPQLNQLRGVSRCKKLRPQIMALLVYLAERQGRVVSADELLDEVWAGKVVTPASIYNSVAELRQALAGGDDGVEFVETIPKRGYRLVATVSPVPDDAARTSSAGNRARIFALTVVLATIVALVWGLVADRRVEEGAEATAGVPPADAPRRKRSIAVLPFDDMSPARDLGWFSDGVTEEILNSLARLPELNVAARTSAFLAREKGLSIAEIAETLGVRVIVEGSVRRDGDDVRVTYQLIRAEDGFHILSDTIDMKFRDILMVQEQIAITIAEALDVALDEQSRNAMFSLGTRDVEAYEFYLRGKDLLYDWFATGNTEAIWSATELFDKAIEEDSRFGFAHALRAHTFMRFLEGVIPYPTRPDSTSRTMDHAWALEQMLADLSKAAEFALTPDTRNLFEISLVVFSDDFRSLPDLANRFDPRVAGEIADGFDVYHILAALLITGRTAAVLDFSERRIRRNPLDGLGYNQAWSAAMVAGNRELGSDYLQRAIEHADDLEFTEQNLLLSRVVGQDWEAAAELATRPGWGIEVLREPILAFVHAAGGQPAEARSIVERQLAAGRFGPYLALALRELGRPEEARAMIGRIDASPAGNLVGMYMFAELGGLFPFEADWMPNFSARLAEANVVLNRFRIETTGEPTIVPGRDE